MKKWKVEVEDMHRYIRLACLTGSIPVALLGLTVR